MERKIFCQSLEKVRAKCNNQQSSTRHEPTSKSCFWAAKSSKVSSIQKSINYSDTHFQLNQTPPLEVLSSRSRIFQKLSVFSVKFTFHSHGAGTCQKFQLAFLLREF